MSWGQACERELFFKIKDQPGMGTGGYQLAMVSWSWNEKMGSNSQSTVLGQSSRHKYWGQFTPKCFKDRTWRVYESDFMFDLSAGSWPKRSLAALWTDHIPSSLPSNPFRELVFLGSLPYITHHSSLSTVSHTSHALSLFLLCGLLLWSPQHREIIFHTMALVHSPI